MNSKNKGSIGELVVATEAVKRGYVVSFVYGDNAKYDLIIDRGGILSKIQVKSVTPNGYLLRVHARSVVRNTDQQIDATWTQTSYTANDIDYMAVVNLHTHDVYLIPVEEVVGKGQINLRVSGTPPKGTEDRTRYAADYLKW